MSFPTKLVRIYQSALRGLRASDPKRSRPSLLIALIGVFVFGTGPIRAEVVVGDPFPSLTVAGLSGSVPEIAGHVVLVDFWASWCAPCKASFPAFAKLNADYAPKGLVIVAVSVDEKAGAYASFVQKWQPPFAVVRDAEQKLVNTVKVPSMPTSYLLGRDGRVRFLHRGFHGSATEQELRQHIEVVLAEKQ